MKIVFTGSRTLNESIPWVKAAVKGIVEITDALAKFNSITIIQGGAKGIDRYIKDVYAKMDVLTRTPEYAKYRGRSAPIIRNKEMVDLGDVVIGIWDGKSPGTKQCMEYALQKGKTLFPMVESNYLKVLEQMRKWVEDVHATRIVELEIRMCDGFIGLAGFMDRCDAVSHSQTAKDILRSQYRIIKKY